MVGKGNKDRSHNRKRVNQRSCNQVCAPIAKAGAHHENACRAKACEAYRVNEKISPAFGLGFAGIHGLPGVVKDTLALAYRR